jgi:DNA-binding XRE family transcriptional regulator
MMMVTGLSRTWRIDLLLRWTIRTTDLVFRYLQGAIQEEDGIESPEEPSGENHGTVSFVAESHPPLATLNEAPQPGSRQSLGNTKEKVTLPAWARNLRDPREGRALSRGEAAKKLGFSADTIKKNEEGKAYPEKNTRCAYAKLYGTTEECLFPKE